LYGHSTLTMTSRYLGTSMTHMKKAVTKLPSLGMPRGRKKRKVA
jgi:hypothetical protein